MDAPEVRDVERRFNLWGGFRDEMIATAMTLSLLVVGSFILTERTINPKSFLFSTKSTPSATPQTLGVSDVAPAVIEPTPQPTLSPPTPPVDLAEVVYGQDGDYDFEGYSISFRNPRITFEAKTNAKRKLWVNIWVKNKSIAEGIVTKLTASIIKDGEVIVPTAALNIPNPRKLNLGEEVSFEASLSLIEGTDVRELKFKPGNGIAEASHFLYQ